MAPVESKQLPSFRIPFLLCVVFILSAIGRAEQLPIKTYTTVEGLAYNEVNKIVRDSRGFLWFCTGDGLSRFDGYTFTNYGRNQGLPHAEVNDLLETREGEYWVATNGGLVRFNPKARPEPQVVYASHGDSRPQPMFTVVMPEGDVTAAARGITTLLEDVSGAIWCGTYSGLYRLERSGERLSLLPVDIGIPRDASEERIISDVLQDASGSLWVATPGGLYRRWPDGSSARYTVHDGLPDNYLHDLLKDHQGRLWAGTRYAGFFEFSADATHNPPVVARAFSMKEGMPAFWVFQLFETSDHQFWVATAAGLVRFFPNRDERGKWFRSYSERNGLSYHDITTVAEDIGGNLWLGTNHAGAMKLERNGFVTYDRLDGICTVNSIFSDLAGGVCFRGSVFGDKRTSVFEGAKLDALGRTQDYHYTRLGRFDGQRFSWFKPKAVTDFGWLSEGNTLQTRNGEWWVSTGRGLYRFPSADKFDQVNTARPLAVYGRKDALEGHLPYRLFEDSQGNVWVSAMSASPLSLWERGATTLRDLSKAPGLPAQDTLPRSFAEDRGGNIWIGFNSEVARYHNGIFKLFTASDGLPFGLITSIYLDHAGRLWLASSRSGLIRVDNPQAERPAFVSYTTEQGLSSNSSDVFADKLIVEDLQGQIYIGTGRGLDRLDPATGDFRHFTVADGLAPGSLKSCYRDRSGGLWFGATGGLSYLAPSAEGRTPAPPPAILISDLHVGGSPQFISALGESEMVLPDLASDQTQLQIDFVGLSFAPGEQLRYEYELEGADADWSAPSEGRTVNYARLAPGHYRFVVRAVTADGVVSSQPASLAFKILPPFWRRSWFVTLGAAVLTLLVFGVHRRRVARLVELERVRTRIATDLHDDIGSSLSRMAILSEVAKRRMGNTEPESASVLTEIADSARDVVSSMSDIVWAIDPRRDDLRNVVFRVRQFASDLLGAKGIEWAMDAHPEFDRVKLRPELRRHLFLIFKEAINNSARHADCKTVWLNLTVVHNRIIAEIRDDGHGFTVAPSPEAAGNGRGGHGLENIRSRAAQVGGSLRIDSAPGHGTTIRIDVPLKRAMA